MSTILLRTAFEVVHNYLEEPRLIDALLSCVNKFQEGFFPEWYTSIFFQKEVQELPFSIY